MGLGDMVHLQRPRHEVDKPGRYVPSSPTNILPACRKCNNDIGAMIYYGSRVAFVALAFCMYMAHIPEGGVTGL